MVTYLETPSGTRRCGYRNKKKGQIDEERMEAEKETISKDCGYDIRSKYRRNICKSSERRWEKLRSSRQN